MEGCARDGTPSGAGAGGGTLAELVAMAIPLCQAAEALCPRAGPGRPPEYRDWQVAVMIMAAVMKKRKSKSSQYRFLLDNAGEFKAALGLEKLPVRSTYFQRYRHAHRLFKEAVQLQGRKALREHVADARVVAADKSLIEAPGPRWHRDDRRRGAVPDGLRGVDRECDWGYSPTTGWVHGYSYEVVVAAPARRRGRGCKGRRGVGRGVGRGVVFPLLASAGVASASEHRTFGEKVDRLPRCTKDVLADGGYDGNAHGERVERDPRTGRRTGRRFVCPPQSRGGKPALGVTRCKGERERRRLRRARRAAFYKSPRGRRLYARRGRTVEPFNQWFKHLFELEDRAWHRGLGNNRTQLLAALFCYQLLVRYARRRGRGRAGRRRPPDAQIQWILDGL